MIQFVTLLLGLTLGVKPVEVAVAGDVAAVELRLDGRSIGRLEGPPWTLEVDFGHRLEPRLVEAVAYDKDGAELEVARQTVNFARSNYEAVLVLESGEGAPDGGRGGGPPDGGRLVWHAIRGLTPSRVELRFDGAELPIGWRGRFRLPAYDIAENHYLEAELLFPPGRVARVDLSFGGIYGERVTSALTAVPMLVPPGQVLPPPDAMAGWLEAGGEALRVFEVAAEGAMLVIVRDRNASKGLRLPREARRRLAELGRLASPETTVAFAATSPDPGSAGVFRSHAPKQVQLESGLWDLVTMFYPPPDRRRKQHLWDSLAVAGSAASGSDRPRAVFMILSAKLVDDSALEAAQARGYLRSIRVPFFCWVPDAESAPQLGTPDGLYAGAGGMVELFEALQASLAQQRIVWLEGAHLPHRIQASAAVPATLRLAE